MSDNVNGNGLTFPTGKVYSRYDPEILELIRQREEESRRVRPEMIAFALESIERNSELLHRLATFKSTKERTTDPAA